MQVREEDAGDEEPEYVVGAILDHRKKNGRTEFSVAWQGYNEQTWEPAENLQNNEQFEEYIREWDLTGFVHENPKEPI